MDGYIRRYCSTCHKPFSARRRSAKYCSVACKSKAQRLRLSGDIRSWDGTPFVDLVKLKVLERLVPRVYKRVYSIPFARGRHVGQSALDAAFLTLIEVKRWDIALIFEQERDKLYRETEQPAQRQSSNSR